MKTLLLAAVPLVLIAPPVPEASYQLCATGGCRAAEPVRVLSSYTRTRYPLVFAHGMGGFSRIGNHDYWYGIPKDLTATGSTVYLTQVSSFHSSEVRGEQLLKQVEDIVAISGAGKVNLFGHSHGAMSIRYVAAVRPDLVASVTSIGGPNKGSEVADRIQSRLKHSPIGPQASRFIGEHIDRVFTRLDSLSGQAYPQDALASLDAVTTAGALRFNRHFPQGVPVTACGEGAPVVNGVHYYSWSGAGHLTNLLDISDGALAVSGLLIDEPNDGLVGHCSSHLGQVIRDNYFMNHLDEVNQLYGLVSMFETNPKTVYRQHANRLKQAGL